MRQQSSQFIELNYFKIVVSILLLIGLFSVGYSIHLYGVIRDHEDQGFEQSIARVKEAYDPSTIEEVTRYHGEVFYHVIHTRDEESVTYYFVNQTDETAAITTYTVASNDPLQPMIATFKSERPTNKVIRVNVGLRQQVPIVEIVSTTTSGTVRYDYYRLTDGTYESGLTLNNVN
ncbi:hypothetical protein HMI01_12770 [Halolactibacillus miurensis]|uniref:Uncharacterized protein YpmB n=1 Tax=Halolactibacillus miurensis TaxID=306541 RepID=A0A1I6SXS1_9BACI|nr:MULTISPECIES: hypothetical protein [Halolactibacillus]GEM04289.1 hypothetical protein HMI01_12770 [Halolactibacillus miurensis]SFS81719.1 Uncharacterized protein YpmB [Halolactibacillus miurensis]